MSIIFDNKEEEVIFQLMLEDTDNVVMDRSSDTGIPVYRNTGYRKNWNGI